MPNKNKLLLSICIPTYNRQNYLKELLDALISQITHLKISNQVEIIISDNASTDSTEKLIKGYKRKYKYIRYYKNRENIGMANLIYVSKYASGKYIWFSSDDDLPIHTALKIGIETIKRFSPDIIFCNVDSYSKNMRKVVSKNELRVQDDLYFHSRRDFFNFLNTKFLYPIDWYVTFYSCLIMKRDIAKVSYRMLKKYNSSLDLQGYEPGIYYVKKDYNIYIIAKSLIKFRNANTSWRPERKLEFLKLWDKLLVYHYKQIYGANKDVLSFNFYIKIKIKELIRKSRIFYMTAFQNV